MSEVTFLISRCIANFRSSRVDGFGAYTMSFKYPHRKKIQWPNAVRPGRNQFITKCFLYRAKNSPNMCGIAPSYWLSIAAGWMPRLRRAGMNLFFSKCKCHSLLSVLTSPSASKKKSPNDTSKTEICPDCHLVVVLWFLIPVLMSLFPPNTTVSFV